MTTDQLKEYLSIVLDLEENIYIQKTLIENIEERLSSPLGEAHTFVKPNPPALPEKHFYDSITIAFDFEFASQSIVDVGAGAGFPSIPLKIIYPDLKVTIVDSLTKRITFLNRLFEALELTNCKAISARAEEYAKENREKCDVVMARAVARLNILDELCLPLVKVGGYFLSLKGLKADEELNEAKKGIGILGGKVESVNDFTLTNDNHRSNIIIKKVKATPNKYPRMFAKIKKQPL